TQFVRRDEFHDADHAALDDDREGNSTAHVRASRHGRANRIALIRQIRNEYQVMACPCAAGQPLTLLECAITSGTPEILVDRARLDTISQPVCGTVDHPVSAVGPLERAPDELECNLCDVVDRVASRIGTQNGYQHFHVL